MKKNVLLVFAFVSSSISLFAQGPTLTSANSSPKPGDSYITQSAAVTGIPQYSGGANQNWNYGNLVDSGESVAFQAVVPSSTAYADSFPESNLAIKTLGDSVFSYFNSSSTALLAYGVATKTDSDPAVIRYNPSRTVLPYPFAYTNSFIDSLSVQNTTSDFSSMGADTITGDGYGTLILPGRTFSNVLRVKYIEDITSSGELGGFLFTLNTRTTSYLYYSPGTTVPVLSYVIIQSKQTSTIGGNTIVQSNELRSIDYLKAFVLPVTFQSFKASLQNKDVSLQWKTAQEINTDHYTVQRSLTGRDFQDVASVKATGSGQGSLYNYIDKSFAGGNVPATVYYRIQEVDKDGKQTVSSVAIVHGNHAIVISLYPNPASDFIRIGGNDVAIADAIAIYDAKGSLVQQWRNYSISQPINIAGLSKGTYLVKVTANGKTTTTALLKQ